MAVSAREFGQTQRWVTAQRLRARRDSVGLTQEQVRQRLEERGLRLSKGDLSVRENGGGIDSELLPIFADVLECSITYLLGYTDDPTRWDPERTLRHTAKPSKHSRQTRPRSGSPTRPIQLPLVSAVH